MKKGLVALVILGAIAGTVAYKLKKNQEEKEMLDEELDILSSDESNEEETEETEDIFEENEVEEIFEDNEEDEEVAEYDFSDKCVESVCEEDNCEDKCESEEIISEEIEENPLIHAIDEELKKKLELDSDEVITQLDEENDAFEEERPIQHFIDFKSVEDMEAYKACVIQKGYVVTRGENPYQLSVLHIAPINKSELLVNVYFLANKAIKYNGSYQGWQSRKVL